MSKIKGVIPLLLATSFGIINGIWVFQPLLAAQQEGLDKQIKWTPLDATDQSKENDVKPMRETEGAVSQSSATEPALKSIPSSSSSWSNVSFWSKSESAGVETSAMGPRTEAKRMTIEGKEENS